MWKGAHDGCTFKCIIIYFSKRSNIKRSLGASPPPVNALLLTGTQNVRYFRRVLEYSITYSPSTPIANYSDSTALDGISEDSIEYVMYLDNILFYSERYITLRRHTIHKRQAESAVKPVYSDTVRRDCDQSKSVTYFVLIGWSQANWGASQCIQFRWN